MKRRFAQCSAVASTLAAIVFAPTATAQNKCDNPATVIDQRVCAKADESMDALRQFIWRTRVIWNLNMADYGRSERPRLVISVTANPMPREMEVPSKEAPAVEAK